MGLWTSSTSGGATYTGVSVADGVGTGRLATIHPEDRPQLVVYWRARLDESGTRRGVEAWLRRSDGTFRWFLIRAVPVCDEGRPRGEVVWPEHRHRRTEAEQRPCSPGKSGCSKWSPKGYELPTVLEDALMRLRRRSVQRWPLRYLVSGARRHDGAACRATGLPSDFSQAIRRNHPFRSRIGGRARWPSIRMTQVIVADIGQDASWDNFEWCGLALYGRPASVLDNAHPVAGREPPRHVRDVSARGRHADSAADGPDRASDTHCQHCDRARTSRRDAQTDSGDGAVATQNQSGRRCERSASRIPIDRP